MSWLSRLFKKKKPPVVIIPPVEPTPEIPTKKENDPFPIMDFKFVDSSDFHPYFDVKKYPAPFLSNKCSQGIHLVHKTHAIRKKLCEENGIAYSGYHFYECRKDPIDQAHFYFINHGKFTSPPQIDYETYDGIGQDEQMLIKHKEDLYKCLLEIEKLTGMTPWLYINYSAAFRMKFDKKFGRFTAWFARYNSVLGPIPYPWTEETTGAWQFTDTGTFSGFKGGGDINIYYGKVNAANLNIKSIP